PRRGVEHRPGRAAQAGITLFLKDRVLREASRHGPGSAAAGVAPARPESADALPIVRRRAGPSSRRSPAPGCLRQHRQRPPDALDASACRALAYAGSGRQAGPYQTLSGFRKAFPGPPRPPPSTRRWGSRSSAGIMSLGCAAARCQAGEGEAMMHLPLSRGAGEGAGGRGPLIDRITPTLRPDTPVVGYQQWRDLLFLHWPMPVEVLRPLVPEPLAI